MAHAVPIDPAPPWSTALAHPTPDLPPRADVVVVGASAAGLAAASLLAPEARVVVLDADSATGDGVDRRGPAQALGTVVEHPWRLEKSLGPQAAKALWALGVEGLRRLDAHLPDVPHPGLLWAATEADREPAELLRSAETLARLGVHHATLDPEEVARRTGTVGLHDALWFGDAWAVDRAALRRDLSDVGCPIVSGAQASVLDETGDGVTLTLADGRRIEAEVVILAAGYDSRRLHPYLHDTLVPVREVAIQRPGPPGPITALRAGFGWMTMARDRKGAVTISGCRWASPHLEQGETDPHHAHPDVLKRLLAAGDRFFPALGPPTAQWGWIEAHGCDNLPLVGPLPSSRRILLCTGFGADGLGLGFGCGHAVAEGLMTGSAPQVPACLDPARFLP